MEVPGTCESEARSFAKGQMRWAQALGTCWRVRSCLHCGCCWASRRVSVGAGRQLRAHEQQEGVEAAGGHVAG